MAKKKYEKEVDVLTKQIEAVLHGNKVGVIQSALKRILKDTEGNAAEKYPDSIVGYFSVKRAGAGK